MSRRVDAEVRQADPNSPWIQAGEAMIAEAHRLICDVQALCAARMNAAIAR
jgi:hypothetical protein